ncbi:ribonuclease P protein component [Sulfuriferula sp.]|uniref:ribonuclease P protein component n=1 Tax=Sulfuriferula sp. TaxID=2025307 RepID=UPI00273071A5|nr:ribonuclease P protein component [Sulfuriferula sp.]
MQLAEMGDQHSGASGQQGFPRDRRLLKTDEYSSVFNFRCSQGGSFCRVYARPNTLANARLGIVVGKRELRTAVARNLAKRTVRELFRLHQADLAALDFVVRIVKPFGKSDVLLVREELLRLLHKSKRCQKS